MSSAIPKEQRIACPTCQGTGYMSIQIPLGSLSLANITQDPSDRKEMTSIRHSLERLDSTFCLDTTSISLKNPQEELKHLQRKLKSVNSVNDDILDALSRISEIVKSNPSHATTTLMATVYRSLSSLLQSRCDQPEALLRLAAEFFEHGRSAQRPELDKLVLAVLAKSCHKCAGVREAAARALAALTGNVSYKPCLRILTSAQASEHKNPEVRAACAAAVKDLLMTGRVARDLLAGGHVADDCRKSVFRTVARFLIDGNSATRTHAKQLIKHLLIHDEFEALFQQVIEPPLYRMIEKEFVALKYSV
ncbi:hypothetical protein TKK_0015095 [Trichogramma kaykai]|uniref:TOG domain-containing protein n=1 Tax=Trichogramma kaykai TaxID=54128 RepID=A0ABD2WB60_9HYME